MYEVGFVLQILNRSVHRGKTIRFRNKYAPWTNVFCLLKSSKIRLHWNNEICLPPRTKRASTTLWRNSVLHHQTQIVKLVSLLQWNFSFRTQIKWLQQPCLILYFYLCVIVTLLTFNERSRWCNKQNRLGNKPLSLSVLTM